MTPDRPVLGIVFMLGFCVLAPFADSLAKLLSDRVPLYQLVLVRFATQVLILVPLALWTAGTLRMSRRALRFTFYRTVLHLVVFSAMFAALGYLPLADAVAIAFVMPFIMLLLGRTVLNETVGPHRLSACAVGFLGTLLVVQPNFVQVGAPALLPLLVAVVFALFMLVTRQIAKDVDPIAMQAVSGIMALVILGFVYLLPLLGLFLPGLTQLGASASAVALIWPDPPTLILLAMIGGVGTFAHLLMTWSLRYAPSATLAPMQYLEIPVATVIGFLIFNALPNRLAALGIAITIAAGLYILARERMLARGNTQQVAPDA